MIPTLRFTFFTALLVALIGLGSMAEAADPAIARFDKAMKAETEKIRKTINKTKLQRAKNSFQKTAARKYTVNYDRTYSQVKKHPVI